MMDELGRMMRARYGESAILSILGDHFVLAIKGADGVIRHKGSHSADEIAAMITSVNLQEKMLSEWIEEIYEAYPRKRDRAASIKAIQHAVTDRQIPHANRPEYLLAAVRLYAIHCQRKHIELNYIPYPATWMNRQSYLNQPEAVLHFLQANALQPAPSASASAVSEKRKER